MAKLPVLPDPEVIRSFKGLIDFYNWKNIAVARRWPRWRITARSPAVIAQQAWLRHSNTLTPQLGHLTHRRWQWLAKWGFQTWRDKWLTYYYGTVGSPFPDHARNHSHQTPFTFPDPEDHYFNILQTYGDFDENGVPWLHFRTTSNLGVRMLFAGHPPVVRPVFRRRGRILSLAGYHYVLQSPLATSYAAPSEDGEAHFNLDAITAALPANILWVYFWLRHHTISPDHYSLGMTPVMKTLPRRTSLNLAGFNFAAWTFLDPLDPRDGDTTFIGGSVSWS